MGRKKKVKDVPHLEKDVHSKAILNTNKSAYQAALQSRKQRKATESDYEDLKNRVAILEKLFKKLDK